MSSAKTLCSALFLTVWLTASIWAGRAQVQNPVDTLDPWDWRASDWGAMVNGVAMRVITRPEIAYGEPLEMFIEFRVDTTQLPAKVRRWTWAGRLTYFSLQVYDNHCRKKSSTEIPCGSSAFSEWNSTKPKEVRIAALGSIGPKLTCGLGYSRDDRQVLENHISDSRIGESQAQVVTKKPRMYQCELSVCIPSEKPKYWSGSISTDFDVSVADEVYVTYLHKLVVPSKDRTCASCSLGVAVDTIPVRIRPDYFLVDEVYTQWDRSVAIQVTGPYPKKSPSDTIIDLLVYALDREKRGDTATYTHGVRQVKFFECPEPFRDRFGRAGYGCRVLWSAVFECVREKGIITSMRPTSDSSTARTH